MGWPYYIPDSDLVPGTQWWMGNMSDTVPNSVGKPEKIFKTWIKTI